MSRCISCNKSLVFNNHPNTDSTLLPDGQEESMCRRCIKISFNEWCYTHDKTYAMPDVKEGLTPPAPIYE